MTTDNQEPRPAPQADNLQALASWLNEAPESRFVVIKASSYAPDYLQVCVRDGQWNVENIVPAELSGGDMCDLIIRETTVAIEYQKSRDQREEPRA